ncbi:MAG: hypothetical protein ACI8SK_000339 [Shewanella sp.]|jgi:hypothetical protein
MRYLLIALLFFSYSGIATANDDEKQIRQLIQNLYVDGTDANLQPEAYLYRYFLPSGLKRLQIVSGADGERKDWKKRLNTLSSDKQGFLKFLEMLKDTDGAAISFYENNTRATLAVEERPPRFTKYMGQWYAAM